jgi:uncharacterized protein YdbL (DUF1318 family)
MTAMTIRKMFVAAAGAMVIAAGVASAPVAVYAQTAADKAAVDAAKTQGLVGEQGDGYLGVVRPGGPAAAVAAINAGRASAYAGIAAKTGTPASAVGEAAAQQLFDRLPSGQYYRPLGGDWTRK